MASIVDDEKGQRLDSALIARGLATSRERAKETILAGEVIINDRVVRKAATRVMPNDVITCKGEPLCYVGRGGYKLEKAIALGGFDLKGLRAMDVGSSTGGFTDCMLQNGAEMVYAIDVGHGQLHAKLKNDERVRNLEGMDVRDTDHLLQVIELRTIQFCSIDVSFISVKKVISAILPFLSSEANLVCLIKPQFEAGRAAIGKNGVVKDPKVHRLVISDLLAFFVEQGCHVLDLSYSPITGGEGNIEYLALLRYSRSLITKPMPDINITTVIDEAHKALRG